MGHHDHLGVGVKQALEGRESGANTAVVSDVLIAVERDVKVRANQNLLAGEIAERINSPQFSS